MAAPCYARIVLAPDSFKESLTAVEAAEAMAEGVCAVIPAASCRILPMADGGEGTVEAVAAALGAELRTFAVTGPQGETIEAKMAWSRTTRVAVVEMAAASGLALVPTELRNPMLTTSYGTGELIAAAVRLGARRIIVGLGGSATVDGGAGILQAMGASLLNAEGKSIARGGAGLLELERIHLDGLRMQLGECKVELACDVNNPLLGETGAAAVFGPQKGATPEMVVELERGLERLANALEAATGRDVRQVPGAGAAGGAGAALIGACGAEMRSGGQLVADLVELEDAIREADLVFTGEGRFDAQTLRGKLPSVVAEIAQRHGKPTVVLAGSVGEVPADELKRMGIHAAISITPPGVPLAIALRDAAVNMRRAAAMVADLWIKGRL